MIWIILGITTLGMIIAFVISLRMGNTIIKRIRILKKATEAIASGNLDYRLSPDKISGFDILDEAFNDMSKSLKDRDERLQKAHEQLTRSEETDRTGTRWLRASPMRSTIPSGESSFTATWCWRIFRKTAPPGKTWRRSSTRRTGARISCRACWIFPERRRATCFICRSTNVVNGRPEPGQGSGDLPRHRGRNPFCGEPSRGERRSFTSGGGVPQSVHQCRRRHEGEGRQAPDHDLVLRRTGSR